MNLAKIYIYAAGIAYLAIIALGLLGIAIATISTISQNITRNRKEKMKPQIRPDSDCTRRSQLNQSIDQLLKKHRSPWQSEHRLLHDRILCQRKLRSTTGKGPCQ